MKKPMDMDERYRRKDAFAKDFRLLVHRHVGAKYYDEVDAHLLAMLQDCTSCYQPYVWNLERKVK